MLLALFIVCIIILFVGVVLENHRRDKMRDISFEEWCELDKKRRKTKSFKTNSEAMSDRISDGIRRMK